MPIARHLRAFPLLGVTAIASLLAIASPRPAHGAATIAVNTVVDEDTSNSACSLREAIMAANTNVSHNGCAAAGAGVGDKILFNLGTGTPTINIGSTPLPTINEAVTIDGGTGRVELHGPGGAAVSGHHGLTVGQSGFGTIIRNLVINNFGDDGIFIDADEVDVYGCFIGTDATGMTAVPNQGFGVQVGGGNGVRIGGATSGGSCTGDCNVISGAVGNKANVFLDLNATGALVRGNFIGTNVTGTAGITNHAPGVIDKGGIDRIGGPNGTTLGGACTGDCNLISGNNGNDNPGITVDQAGIVIEQPAGVSGPIIQGNFIGTDVTGNDAISNGTSEDFSFGILSLSPTTGAMIGGSAPHARNVVSGNLGNGIQVSSPSTIVQGNYIGTNSAGTAAVPNSGAGVYVFQTNGVTIGGTTPGAGNLISGASTNTPVGVLINESTNTQITGNLIGTAADGTTPLPNQAAGIVIGEQSSNNTIGGIAAAAANTIAFNGIYGVVVVGAGDGFPVHDNAIRGNSIYANGQTGIALVGGNDDLGFPIIEGIGPLHGTSCAHCTVEIFSDSENQGRVFEGSVFTTDGNWTFNGPLSGPHVTATNTDMSNNTSEFSAPFSLLTQTPTPSATVAIPTSTATRTPTRTPTSSETPTSSSTPTPTRSATSTVTRTATTTGSATATPTLSPSATGTGSSSPTNTRTVSSSATPTVTSTRSASPTPTVERTATGSATATPTLSPSATGTGSSSPTNARTASSSATPTVTSTRSASPTPTVERTATATPTVSGTATSLPSSTPARSASATPSATTVSCTGDCDGSGAVSINELIIGVNIALGTLPASACPAFENAEGTVDIAQLIRGVNNLLTDCESVSQASESDALDGGPQRSS